MSRLERSLLVVLRVELGLLFLLLCAGPFLLSLQADEAWNLLPIGMLAETGVYAHPATPPAFMSAGPYLLAEFVLYQVGGNSLPLLRSFPLLCLLLLLATVALWARRSLSCPPAALLAPCVLLAVPGTLGLGSAAFAVVPAMLLLLWGVLAWAEWPGWKGALVAGVLFGLATATRANVGVIFPALLCTLALQRQRWHEFPRAVGVSVVGVAVFAGSFAVLALLDTGDAQVTVSRAAFVTGIGNDLGVRQLFQKLVIANGFMTLPLMVAASLAGNWAGRRSIATARATGLLTSFAWTGWLVWLLIAPLPHLRYLWPSLASFAIVLGLGLAALYEWGRQRSLIRVRTASLLLGAACLATGGGITYRNLALGDLNFLTWEWAEAIPVSARADFRLVRNQRRMAAYLASLPGDVEVGALDFALELEFLSGRRLPLLRGFMTNERWREETLPRRLLTTTHLGRRGHLDPRAHAWLQNHCELEARFGPYALWRVVGTFPEDPGILRFSVGRRQPYAGWPKQGRPANGP